MQNTTYGLRHMPSGRILNLDARSNHDEDCCNAETCELTLDNIEPGYIFRYETERFADVVETLMNPDPGWYNSSRERPMLGNFDPEELHMVAFRKTYDFDARGGDPVMTTEIILPISTPEMIAGRVVGTRSPEKIPKRILSRRDLGAHIDAWETTDKENDFVHFVTMIPTEEMPANTSMGYCIPVQGNHCSILSDTPLPDTWPADTTEDLTKARLLLVKTSIEPRFLDDYEQPPVPSPR
ncbi:hypothetical protein [Roseibium sp. RKSG952]|uniref:hypothetical protein n=1 Tax=Roseibium sp. RKSG952 TaxID=2529384 RepID=UPI0012BBF6DC|nr:hypothetical protein [Roseibium sp. RKSG952]MTH95045.1 hypothetical protein [Roseibium sp. RKSG952]